MSLFVCIFANRNRKKSNMQQTLDTLKRIEGQTEALGQTIRTEGQVAQAELEERQRLGLHGEAAIKHYNEWMQRYGMADLMVKKG